MSKKNILLLHLFVWLFAAFSNLRNVALLADPEQRMVYFVSTLYLAIPFYLFYSLLVPRFLERKRYPGFLVVAAAAVVLLPFPGYTALLLVRAGFQHDFGNFLSPYSLNMHLSGMTVVSMAAAFGTFFKVIVNWVNVVRQKEILEKEKAVSELALLKSKVNPHFLFNTLNNIDVLIYDDRDRASQALLKLSGIMRYMTYETASEYVALSKEIGYISDIVALYSLRISDPSRVRLEIPSGYPDLEIVPMLFIPFIENAFKYATMKGTRPGIDIRFVIDGRTVQFECVNPFEPAGNRPPPGFGGTGIDNVKRRLDYLYPGRYQLGIHGSDGLFTVNLTIHTHGNQVHSH